MWSRDQLDSILDRPKKGRKESDGKVRNPQILNFDPQEDIVEDRQVRVARGRVEKLIKADRSVGLWLKSRQSLQKRPSEWTVPQQETENTQNKSTIPVPGGTSNSRMTPVHTKSQEAWWILFMTAEHGV